MPNKITHLLYSWGEVGAGAADRDRWRIVPVCIWWIVWKERNAGFFESKTCDLQMIRLSKQMYLEDTESIIDILGSC